MSIIQIKNPARNEKLRSLFATHRASFLIETVLEGQLGSALADDPDAPNVAMLRFADVVTVGGDVDHPAAVELVKMIPMDKGILPMPDEWTDLLHKVLGESVITIERFAFSGEHLDRDHLNHLVEQLPDGYHIRRIDLNLARQIDSDSTLISEDHVRNFNNPQDFVSRGIGFVVLYGGKIVSGASSYAICSKGIEIQVNTNTAYRQRGLATAVSAALLTHCLEHNIDAHWDAGNPISARLAERLGYTQTETYEMLVRIN